MKTRNFFLKISGDDYIVIRKCSVATQNRFVLIGMFIFIISVLCFISSLYSFTQLFDNYLIGIPIAIFFSLMITNIYLLLLHTLTKRVLPHPIFKKSAVFTVMVRLVFISLIALIISKPLEAGLFSMPLQNEIVTFKKEKLKKYTNQTAKYFDTQIDEIKNEVKQQRNIKGDIDEFQAIKYNQLIKDKETEKNKLIEDMQKLVKDSNYYIRSIIILNSKYPICWLLTLAIIIMFLVPAYKKHQLPLDSNYYRLKRTIETDLVKKEYAWFKQKYNSTFIERYGLDINYVQPYDDAPFNTIPKTDDKDFMDESVLISELYDA